MNLNESIKIKKLCDSAITPTHGSVEAAGLDLFTIQDADILPGQRAVLKTGIAMEIPFGMVGLIWPRSKLAVKMGIDVLAGVVDSDYRGEVMISLLNTSDKTVELRKSDKCAQIIIQKHYSWLPIEVVDELQESDRGIDGINSLEMRLK